MTITAMVISSSYRPTAIGCSVRKLPIGQPHIRPPIVTYISGSMKIRLAIRRFFRRGDS